MTIDELKVKISADISGLTKSVNQAQNELQQMSKQFKSLKSSVSSAARNINSEFSSGVNGISASAKKAQSSLYGFITVLTRLSSATMGINLGDAFSINIENMQSQIAANQEELSILQEKLANTKAEIEAMVQLGQQDTPQYQAQIQAAQELESKIKSLLSETNSLQEALNNLSSQALFGKQAAQIDETKRELTEVNAEIIRVTLGLADLYGQPVLDEGQIEGYKDRLNELYAEQRKLQSELQSMSSTTVPQQSVGFNLTGLDQAKAQVVNMLGTAFDNVKVKIGSAAAALSQFIGKNAKAIAAFKALASAAKEGFSKVISFTGKAISKMNFISPLVNKIGNSIKSLGARVKNVILYSTLIAGFREFENTIKSYLSSNTQLQSALASLKGSWLTAFQPIYDFIVPALISLINWLSSVGAAIARITSALFGTTTSAAKKSASAMYDQANATAAAGGAAEEAQRQIMGFDEINKLEDNSGGGGGGSDSSSIGANFDTPDTTVFSSWGEAFDDLLTRLNAKLPKIDSFFQAVANKINEFNQKLIDMLNYDGVLEKAEQFSAGLGNIVNNFNEALDLGKAGEALGTSLSFIVKSFNSFMDEIKWDEIGQNIADGINHIFSSIKLSDIMASITNLVKMVWESLRGIVTGLKWGEIGTWLAQGLNSIDFVGCVKTITSTIVSALQGLGNTIKAFIMNIDWGNLIYQVFSIIANLLVSAVEILATAIATLLDSIVSLAISLILSIPSMLVDAIATVASALADTFKAFGLDTIAGWFQGAAEGMANVGSKLYSLFQPVIDWIKQFFGIASPSTVMATLGNFVSQGFFQGIKQGWTGINEWISSKVSSIKDTVTSKWETIKSKTSSIWESIKDKITSPLKSSNTESVNQINSMTKSITSATDNMKTSVNTSMNSVKNAFSTAFSNIQSTVSSKISSIRSSFSSGMSSLTSAASSNLNSLYSQFSSKMSSIKSLVQSTASSLRGAFNFNAGRISVTVPYLSVGWNFNRRGSAYAYSPYYNVSYRTYATGGFPEDGMFFANSGELVGQFSNGKTAVANNAQIIEGIRQGVETGMINAIRSANATNSNNGKSSSEIKIYLDGNQMAQRIYPYIENVTNNHGMSLINS